MDDCSTSRLRRTATAVAIVFLVAMLPDAVAAPPASEWVGSWKLTEPDRHENAVERAIEEATADMNFLIRGIARDRLREVCRPAPRLVIERDGDEIAVDDGKRRVVSILDRKASGPDGWAIRRLEDGRLVERLWSDRGARVNEYEARDGDLVVRTRIESKQLPKPVEFEIRYAPE